MNTRRTKQWPQYLAAITATISLAISGSHIGWTSPSLPYLKSPQSSVSITSDEASWIASFYLLGTIPGCVIAAFIVDYYGRKRSLLLGAVPMFWGWILILIGGSPYILYASRFISGIGQGIVYVVCPMYIGEIADSDIRGALGSFIKLMVTFGELYAHAIGPFASYEILCYSCLLLPAVFFLTFSWMPETPYFFLMHERRADAEASLMKLKRYTSKTELKMDLEEINENMMSDLVNRGSVRQLFGTAGNRQAILVSFGLQMILQFSGIAAIESYTQEIFEKGDSGLSAGVAVIILSVIQLIAGIMAAGLVDRAGRRPLLLFTTLMAGVTLTIAGVFCYLKRQLMIDMDGKGWILDSSVMTYELTIALGISPLSYMMLGELFPTNVKGIAVSAANVWASLLAFVVSKLYQVVTDFCGVYVAFAWFATTCFLGVVFITFLVPETKGKSLMEIQEILNAGEPKGAKRLNESKVNRAAET